MNVTTRIGLLVGCVVAVVGCSVPIPGTPSAHSTPSPAVVPPSGAAESPNSSSSLAPPRFTPAVRQPKDARGVAPCDLLTDSQLEELGLQPDTAEPGGTETARTCGWRSNDPGNPAGVQLNTGLTVPVLDGLYLVRDTFAVYELTEVAGHPAVRADGNAGPVCTIYTAISDYQGVATDGNLAGRPLADPCAPSRRMAELILSNLPPLR